jgi:transposase
METTDIALFKLALGDISPWKIKSYTFGLETDSIPELHIQLDFEPGSRFLNDNGESCKVHDSSTHTWRHLDFFQYRCFITCRVPRVKDSKGRVTTIQVPWGRRNNGFTYPFELNVMSLIQKEMPISKVAEYVGEWDQRIWTIFRTYVDKAIRETDFGIVTQLGIDETSRRKGHNYITVAVDLILKRVVFVTKGKNAETIKKIANELDSRGSSPDLVTQVSIDMSPAFIAGTVENFPKAAITFDKFHVVAKVNEGLDNVRRLEKEEAQHIIGMRYSLLKNSENLSEIKFETLWDKLMLMPTIGEAYRQKELLRDFWDFKDPVLAERYLDDWCKEVYSSNIAPMVKVAILVAVKFCA